MNISILQENLKQGLTIISHCVGKNPNLPILSNILIKAEKEITIAATNLEIGVTNTLRGKVEKKGSFTVDAKIFLDYISLLPNQKINIEQNNNNLIIKTEGYKTKIIGEPSDEYPIIPKIEKNKTCFINITDFKKALAQTIFSVAITEIRQELSGVLFSFNESELILASTDSFRLAEKKIKAKYDGGFLSDDKKIIIPAKTLQELIRVLSVNVSEDVGDEESQFVKVYINDNQVLFSIGNTELVSRLIEGQYPDYAQIIPTNSKTTIQVSKSELARAVKTSALFSKTGVNDVNLDFPKGKNKIITSSSSGQRGENITEVEARVKGDDNGIVINCKYLLDGLQVIDSESIQIEVVDNKIPCIIRSSEKKDKYLYVIMPIRQ